MLVTYRAHVVGTQEACGCLEAAGTGSPRSDHHIDLWTRPSPLKRLVQAEIPGLGDGDLDSCPAPPLVPSCVQQSSVDALPSAGTMLSSVQVCISCFTPLGLSFHICKMSYLDSVMLWVHPMLALSESVTRTPGHLMSGP